MKNYYRTILLALDLVFISVSLAGSMLLSNSDLRITGNLLTVVAAVVLTVKVLVFVRIGLYRAVLKYASVDFLVAVLKGCLAGSLGTMLVLYILGIHLAVGIYTIDFMLTVFFVGGSRFAVRYYQEFVARYRKGTNVLIYGAGDLGVIAMRHLKHDKNLTYVPVGFIDDNADKSKSVIQNVPVLGRWSDLDRILRNVPVDEIVVAIAEVSGEKLRKIVRDCRQRNLMCRIVPSLSKVLELEPMVRDLEISDLLCRAPRGLDIEAIDKYIEGKKILVTGAAGSIGSELVRQCIKHNPDEIIAFDQSESGLYNLQEELNYDGRVHCILGDVTSVSSVEQTFNSARPNIVFHAAAYKHVPMLEGNITQAIINNIHGTRVVAAAADKFKADRFVLISTDKAVKPSSVMGATKRVCELVVQSLNRICDTEYVAVRFGNVLGSSGSVIPKFVEQIRNNGPVTITHPEATRYFMLTSEAVQLVLQAATIGNGGNIFILDMGSPVRIVEMAEDLIYLMGKVPYKDIDIEYTGLRPGEKIHEELYSEEIDHGTRYENITVAKATAFDSTWFNELLDKLITEASVGNVRASVDLLNELVIQNLNMKDRYNIVPLTAIQEISFKNKMLSTQAN